MLARVHLVDSLVQNNVPVDSQSRKVQSMVAARQSMRIYINLADRGTLQELPRIGPAMSKRIIAHREKNGYFQTFKDLENVKGIGPATTEKLKPLITFETVRP